MKILFPNVALTSRDSNPPLHVIASKAKQERGFGGEVLMSKEIITFLKQ